MQTQRDVPRGPGTDSSRPDPLTGRILDGRYRIGGRIARGGMASVYQAVDLRLDRTVAVKVMHAGMGDDAEFAARFVREARAAARLSHPHVVAVFDQGDDDGTVFLAMEYVPGHTLRDEIRAQAPLSPARALALIEPIVSALAAAHKAGLIHRDVKPENVLLSTDGKLKVADFGLAKAISSDTQHTATGGVLIGTVSYLAPELVTEGRSDARADVYAAGVVLFELLTGTKPHEGESPIAVAYKHVHTDVPAPSSLVPGIAPYVDALVARATSRDRTQRPADAGVLLHQVHRVAQALRAGVLDDPDLTADLAPRPPAEPAVPESAEEGPEDTAADPFDGLLLDELFAEPRPVEGPVERPVEPSAIFVPEHTAGLSTRPVRSGPTPPAAVVVRPRRRSHKGPLLLLLVLLLAVGAGLGAYWYGVARYTTTPGVLGLTHAEAVAKLEKAGLSAKEGAPDYSETVAAGEVLVSDPKPGARILDDGTVTLTLSLGKERYDVPALAGMTEDQAQDALLATHLGFGSSKQKFNETVPEGRVIRSSPKSGRTLRPDTPVDLVISKGRRPIKIADWTGKSFSQAEQVLTDRGLTIDRQPDQYSDSVKTGVIISQSPVDGTLFKGESVQITVSKGPEMIAVPDGLVATGVDDATEKLESLGFVVESKPGATYLGLGYVMSVDPGQGSMAPKGSTITLYLV